MITAAARSMMMTRGRGTGPYTHLSPAERYIHETRDEALFALLQRHGLERLNGQRILELACGVGSLIRSLAHYGANPRLLEGIDIDPERVATSRKANAQARLVLGTASSLPYRDASFDLVFAFTAFSSMLEPNVRSRTATEALRVLRPGGLLIVYDFRINPLNRATKPLGEQELSSFFSSQVVRVDRVTLAPPLVRLLGGRRALCRPLGRLPWLRTHLLAGIVKEAS